jgi:hypothetical protein
MLRLDDSIVTPPINRRISFCSGNYRGKVIFAGSPSAQAFYNLNNLFIAVLSSGSEWSVPGCGNTGDTLVSSLITPSSPDDHGACRLEGRLRAQWPALVENLEQHAQPDAPEDSGHNDVNLGQADKQINATKGSVGVNSWLPIKLSQATARPVPNSLPRSARALTGRNELAKRHDRSPMVPAREQARS